MTPRVTYEGEIILELTVENSTLGRRTSDVAGQALPSFGSRKVTTRLRLRDGESNLLAGLLREDERRVAARLPRPLRMPVSGAVRRPTTSIADRHRDAADAAHRAHARADGRRLDADLHRHAAEPRRWRSAAAHPPAPNRPPAPPPGAAAAAHAARSPPPPPCPATAPRDAAAAAGGARPPQPPAPPPPPPAAAAGTPQPAAADPAPRQPGGRAAGRRIRPTCSRAERRVARRGRAVHGADLDHRRVAAVDDHADDHLQPGGAARADVQEGTFMRQGRDRARSRSRSTSRRPRRHRDRRASDQAGAAGTGLLAALLFDAGRRRHRDAHRQRRRHGPAGGQRRAVRAGDGGDGEMMCAK